MRHTLCRLQVGGVQTQGRVSTLYTDHYSLIFPSQLNMASLVQESLYDQPNSPIAR